MFTGLCFVEEELKMPEGPSLVILKEELQPHLGKKVLEVRGNAKVDLRPLLNRTINDISTWGKHLLLTIGKTTLRIHFLLFGKYSLDEDIRPEKSLRLYLRTKAGEIYFYTCAIRVLEEPIDDIYDWSADVMSDTWSAVRARKKLKEIPDEVVCDVLLDQNIFSGVGNIIKNEVLYRVKIHPLSTVGALPSAKINAMIREARNYSFDFLEWKKAYVLKKHWLAHTKKICKRCNLPIRKEYLGKTARRTFYCDNCQELF